jgi:hypothetical protein
MVMGSQDNPGTQTGGLRCGMGTHELPQLLRLLW